MPYQSPVQIRANKANPLDIFLEGLEPPDPTPVFREVRSDLAKKSRPASDFGLGFAKAAIGGLKAIPDVIPGLGPGSAPSRFLEDAIQGASSLESPQYKAQQELAAEEMNALAPDDYLGQAGLTAKNILSDPLMSGAKLAGNLVPFAAVGRGAKALQVGSKVASPVINALMGGGAVRGAIYDEIQAAPEQDLLSDPRYAEIRSSLPENEARQEFGILASSYGEAGGQIGAGLGLGALAGTFGAEKAVTGLAAGERLAGNELADIARRNLISGAVLGGLKEGASEFVEEGGQQYLGNVAAAQGGANIDPMSGVVPGAVEGGLLGFGGGAGIAPVEIMSARSQMPKVQPEVRVEETQQETPNQPEPKTDTIDTEPETAEDFGMSPQDMASREIAPITDLNAVIENALSESEQDVLNSVQQATAVEAPLPAESPVAPPDVVDSAPVIQEAPVVAEGVDSEVGPEEPLGAPEASPAVESPAIIGSDVQEVVEPDSQTGKETGPESGNVPAVDTNRTVPFEVPSRNLPVADRTVPFEHTGTVPEPAPEVKLEEVKTTKLQGLDRVQVEGKTGRIQGKPFKGSVIVDFDDGRKNVRVDAKKVVKLPESVEQPLEVASDPVPQNTQELVAQARKMIPEGLPDRAEIERVIADVEADPDNIDKVGALIRAGVKAGLVKRENAFIAARDAIESGKDPVRELKFLGYNDKEAQTVINKVQKTIAKNRVIEDSVDVESKLKASLNPDFARDNDVIQKMWDDYEKSFAEAPAERRARRIAEEENLGREESLLEKAVKLFRTAKEKAQPVIDSVKRAIEPKMTEEQWNEYNDRSEEERSPYFDKGVIDGLQIDGTKFKAVDFEGDVQPSVVRDLRGFKRLADSVSSVAGRIANVANLPKDTFAGFAPNGNFAGVTWRGRVYLNPLKHVESSNPSKIASGLVKTLVHEMVHAAGFSAHDAAFKKEFDRVMGSVSGLIHGMEREIARTLDKQAVSKLRGMYGTAEKGWSVGREKGRKRLERRRNDRAVPRVQPEVERNGSLPPPASKGESGVGPEKGTSGKTEELGSAAATREPSESSRAKDGTGSSGVLKPEFARDVEEELEEAAQADDSLLEPAADDRLAEINWKKKLVYSFVNKFARIGDATKLIEAKTGKKADVDLEEMAITVSPQAAKILRTMDDYMITPLKKLMGESGVSPKEAGEYLFHKSNAEFGKKGVSESKAILDRLEKGPKAEKLKAVESAVRKIVAHGRNIAKASGMKVPDAITFEGPADGLVERAIERTSRTIVKAAENAFRANVATFLTKNPSSQWALNLKNPSGGHSVSFFVDGKKQKIWFKDVTLGKQIESLSDGETGPLMDMWRRGTRTYAVLNTRANPVFPIKNAIRDLFFGLGKIYVDDGPKVMGETLRNLKDSGIALVKYLKDPKNAKGEFAKLADEMYSKGGIPEWFGLQSEADIKANLNRDLTMYDGSTKGKAYKAFKQAVNAMKMFSEVSEAITRLAYYKALKDSNVPTPLAIKKTRGVSGDFQRHGSNKNIRYMYAFFNSAMQGGDAMVKLTQELKDGNPRARNLALFLTGVGASQVLLAMALAGDRDDDGENDYEQLPEYLKNSNLIIPVPGNPVAIPLPYGLNVPIVMGMGIMRSAISNDPDRAKKSAVAFAQSLTKSFNPLGDEATIGQLLSPTLTDPYIQAEGNTDSLGLKIVRDRYPGEGNLPKSQISSRKTSEASKTIAEILNDYTGGSDVKSGMIDIHPDVIDNTARWVLGSAGRFVKDLGTPLVTGKAPDRIPFWNDFVKTPKNYFYTGRFWDQLEEIRAIKDSSGQLDENARKDQLIDLGMDPDRVDLLTRSELRKMVKLSPSRSDALAKEIESISGKRAKLLPMYEELRKQISAIQKAGDPNGDDRIVELVKAANRKYMEATR